MGVKDQTENTAPNYLDNILIKASMFFSNGSAEKGTCIFIVTSIIAIFVALNMSWRILYPLYAILGIFFLLWHHKAEDHPYSFFTRGTFESTILFATVAWAFVLAIITDIILDISRGEASFVLQILRGIWAIIGGIWAIIGPPWTV